jgi:hypothetical protein
MGFNFRKHGFISVTSRLRATVIVLDAAFKILSFFKMLKIRYDQNTGGGKERLFNVINFS